MIDISFSEVLVWLATGGSVLAISWCVEQWNWFATLSAVQKRLAMWASASVLGTGALWITTNVPPETLAVIAGYLQPAIVAFVLIFLQEQFHARTKAPLG